MKTLDYVVLAGIFAAGFLLIKYAEKQGGNTVATIGADKVRDGIIPAYGDAITPYNPLNEGILYT